MQYEMFSSQNPLMAIVQSTARQVRESRTPIARDNPLLAMQERVSQQVVGALDASQSATEKMAEQLFLGVYGSPALQAAFGVDPNSQRRPRKAAKSLLHGALVEKRIAELKAAVSEGGLPAALTRALVYISMSRNSADERGFEAVRRIRAVHERVQQMPLPAFKSLVRDQFFMLLLDEEAALAAIPELLPESPDERRAAFAALREVVEARGSLPDEGARRLERMARLFDLEGSAGVPQRVPWGKMKGVSAGQPSATRQAAARTVASRGARRELGGEK